MSQSRIAARRQRPLGCLSLIHYYYAESVDPIQWVKPNLHQVESNGSLDNNVVRFPDERTQANESERSRSP